MKHWAKMVSDNLDILIYFKPSRPNSGRREKMGLKAFTKPFEARQRSVKIKTELNFYLNKTF